MEITVYPEGCPVCKKGKGRMHQLVGKEIEAGHMSKGLLPTAQISVHVNFDPHCLPIIGARIPAFRAYTDMCEECGAVFTFRQDVGVVRYIGDRTQPFSDLI